MHLDRNPGIRRILCRGEEEKKGRSRPSLPVPSLAKADDELSARSVTVPTMKPSDLTDLWCETEKVRERRLANESDRRGAS